MVLEPSDSTKSNDVHDEHLAWNKKTIDELDRQVSWFRDSYDQSDLSSQDRREIAQRWVAGINQTQLAILRRLMYVCDDADKRAKLSREYKRKQLTLRPPVRYWLRYLLIAVGSVAATLAIQYVVAVFMIG